MRSTRSRVKLPILLFIKLKINIIRFFPFFFSKYFGAEGGWSPLERLERPWESKDRALQG